MGDTLLTEHCLTPRAGFFRQGWRATSSALRSCPWSSTLCVKASPATCLPGTSSKTTGTGSLKSRRFLSQLRPTLHQQHILMRSWNTVCVYGHRFPVGSFAIQTIINSVTSQFSTQSHLEQVCVAAPYVAARAIIYLFFSRNVNLPNVDWSQLDWIE